MFPSKCKALIVLFFFLISNWAFGQYQINGDASQLTCNCYELTPAVSDQVGTVWNVNLIDLSDPFDLSFDIFLGCDNNPNTGADGMAFGLQPLGTGVGSPGQGMGMGGISPSLAVLFDTYQNGIDNDPASDHVSLNANGNVTHDGGPDDLVSPVNVPELENCDWHAFRVSWDPISNTLSAWLDGLQVINYTGDIINDIFGGDPEVYWGFTAATGLYHNSHRFCTQLQAELSISGTMLCPGEEFQMADSSSSFGVVIDQAWDFGDGDTASGAMVTHSYDQPGIYTVSLLITDASGCMDSTEVEVNVIDLIVEAGPDTTICPGQQVQIGGSPTAEAGATFDWQPAATLSDASASNPIASPLVSTTYVVNALNNGCSGVDSMTVFVQPQDLPEFEAYYTPYCEFVLVELELLSQDHTDILWEFGDGSTSIEDDPEHEFDYGESMSVSLTTTSPDGCIGTSYDTLSVGDFEELVALEAPNVFTPNNDGSNDRFRFVQHANLNGCVEISIFNRWGQLQHTSDGSDLFWDGRTTAGVEATPGTYFYVINVRGIELKGSVQLLR